MNSGGESIKDAKEWWQQLPFPYESCKVSQGSRPDGFKFHANVINIEAVLCGRNFTVCGEADSAELAMTKAVAELLERSALFMWARESEGRVISSNGWAAHATQEEAKAAAVFELIERDAVLAQWLTATPFIEIPSGQLPLQIQYWQNSELSRTEFPTLRVLLSTCGLGPSVTCLFMNKDGFGVSSHATRATLTDSIESAIAEACRAAHLSLRKSFWHDTLTLMNSGVEPVEPGAHAVYYAYRESLPTWMFGETVDWQAANTKWSSRINGIRADDFRFESVLDAPLFVGFATNKNALNLNWGPSNLDEILKTEAGKRLATITTQWNQKPHIIS